MAKYMIKYEDLKANEELIKQKKPVVIEVCSTEEMLWKKCKVLLSENPKEGEEVEVRGSFWLTPIQAKWYMKILEEQKEE